MGVRRPQGARMLRPAFVTSQCLYGPEMTAGVGATKFGSEPISPGTKFLVSHDAAFATAVLAGLFETRCLLHLKL